MDNFSAYDKDTLVNGRVLLTSQFHCNSSTNGYGNDCCIEGKLMGKFLEENFGHLSQEITAARMYKNLPKGIKDLEKGHETIFIDAAGILKDSWRTFQHITLLTVGKWQMSSHPPTKLSFKMQWVTCMWRRSMR